MNRIQSLTSMALEAIRRIADQEKPQDRPEVPKYRQVGDPRRELDPYFIKVAQTELTESHNST